MQVQSSFLKKGCNTDNNKEYDTDYERVPLMLEEITLSSEADRLYKMYRIHYSKSEIGKYCYLRCLKENDAIQFMIKFSELLVENCPDLFMRESIISCGYIKMNTWIRIMQKLKLLNNYKLWRPQYWGEFSGRPVKYTSGYHVLIDTFESHNPNDIIVNILHKKGHLKVINAMIINPINSFNDEVTKSMRSDNVT